MAQSWFKTTAPVKEEEDKIDEEEEIDKEEEIDEEEIVEEEEIDKDNPKPRKNVVGKWERFYYI